MMVGHDKCEQLRVNTFEFTPSQKLHIFLMFFEWGWLGGRFWGQGLKIFLRVGLSWVGFGWAELSWVELGWVWLG